MGHLGLSIGEVARIVDGELSRPDLADRPVEHITTDTRRLPPAPFLFVGLTGPNFDGDDFAQAALEVGAAAVIVHRRDAVRPPQPAIWVEAGLDAMQALAAWWRNQFSGRVVGITGSNGKTVVKEMANAILGPIRRAYRSPGSFNSQVGVALSLLRMPRDAEVALIECGISRPGEMDALQRMVRPDHGLLTNVGSAHLAGFGSPRRIAREKLVLFRDLPGSLVVHDSARSLLSDFTLPERVLWVGRDPESTLRIDEARPVPDGHLVGLRMPDDRRLHLALRSHAAHDVDNAACAAAVAHLMGAGPGDIARGLERYSQAPARIEVHTAPSGVTLINDSYSADPISARSALSTLARLAHNRRAVAVLGSMDDLGEETEAQHRALGQKVAEQGVDLLLTVGQRARLIGLEAERAGLPRERVVATDGAEACADELAGRLRPGDVVLVKASRPLHLERTAQRLLEAVSPTRVYIDLGVIAENVRRVRAFIGPRVSLLAVVKSFGYGSDAVRVSELLQMQGADYLVVAYPEEGARLRRRGIELPILVTNILPEEADKVAKYRLSAVVYSHPLLQALELAAQRHGRSIAVHVKLDTGMGRFGLEAERLVPLVEEVRAREGLRLEGVMSHLAAADDARHDAFTGEQIARFRAALSELDAVGLRPPLVHLCNSAGILRFPQAHFSGVRLGIGLYGCLEASPFAPGAPELSPAIALHSRLVGVRELAAGRSVGYGRTYLTKAPTRLGLVALGYNDGVPWALSNQGEMWLRGHRVPIVGSVCMDVTIVDLSGVPEAAVGDDVVIYGNGEHGEPTVPEVARWANTIPYEILCRLSPRVERIVRLAD